MTVELSHRLKGAVGQLQTLLSGQVRRAWSRGCLLIEQLRLRLQPGLGCRTACGADDDEDQKSYSCGDRNCCPRSLIKGEPDHAFAFQLTRNGRVARSGWTA